MFGENNYHTVILKTTVTMWLTENVCHKKTNLKVDIIIYLPGVCNVYHIPTVNCAKQNFINIMIY